jgi:tetratricopeptide (TPR) repeat protein
VTLLLLTSTQIQYWRDSVSLFSHALAVTGPNPGAEGGLAIGLEHAGQPDEALIHYRRAESLNPDDPDNFAKSGRLLMQQQRWAEAEADTRQVLALQPDDFYAHENLGVILPQLGRATEGLQHWETALKLHPDALDLLNNLAWLLATSPDPALRDGPQAVTLAEHACQLTGWQKTIYIGTLAAAYAEAGRFDDAITTAQKACARARSQGETALLQRNQELLTLYQQHHPWHDPAPAH